MREEPLYSWKTENGCTCKVFYDQDAENPREWDNVSQIVVAPRNRYLAPEYENENLTWDDREADLELLKQDFAFVFPLYCLDHSLVRFSTGFIHSPWGHWDCGQLGWVCVTKDAADRESLDEEHALARVKAELEDLTRYANGEVYGYVIEDQDGNELDSCWGFYDLDDIKSYYPEIEEA